MPKLSLRISLEELQKALRFKREITNVKVEDGQVVFDLEGEEFPKTHVALFTSVMGQIDPRDFIQARDDYYGAIQHREELKK